ncbi:MAG: SpoIIE family protein phosphatase [Gammaproteobacteria bacterium]|nr:SpoIIE family protein phosphatase [Gammaproteobacteria bacterium]
MIWESTLLTTLLDLAFVAIAIAGAVRLTIVRRRLRMDSASAGLVGIPWGPLTIAVGLGILGLFYLADLFVLHALGALMGSPAAEELTRQIRLNYNWLVTLTSACLILAGIVLTTGRLEASQAAMRRLNELLEDRVERRTSELTQATQEAERAKATAQAANQALKQQDKQARLLMDVAMAANAADNITEALQVALDCMCAFTGWPVGHAYVPESEESDRLIPLDVWHLDSVDRFEVFRSVTMQSTFERGIGLPGRVLASGKPAWIENVLEDENFPRRKMAEDIGVRGAFGFPVSVHGEVEAVLEFFSDREESEGDEKLFEFISDVGRQLGFFIERKRKVKRLEHDLEVARDIQRTLLPTNDLDFVGFDIAGWNQPADETGGDFFDWFAVPGGHCCFTIADVTGHGIGPALVAAICRAYIRAAASNEPSLTALVTKVNQLISQDVSRGRFVTAAVGILDVSGRKVSLLSAGHGPTLFFHKRSGCVTSIEAQGIPLGIEPTLQYDSAIDLHFDQGDLLVVVTDGFPEWKNPDGEQFGMQRLSRCTEQLAELPSSEIISNLYAEIREFSRGVDQADDLTAVVIKRT